MCLRMGKENVFPNKGGHLTSMTSSAVAIQISPQSVPSIPSWFGEVTLVAHALTRCGVLDAIGQRVRLARRRFGRYDVIDFVAVLIGYMLSGEPTLEAFYARLLPFASPFMALFGRDHLPHRSTLSRFLAALDQPAVEALRTLFQQDLVTRPTFASPPGGIWDREGKHWLIVDVDGTRQAARQRALPHPPELPDRHRRLEQVCAPGYLGRKRGEVVRTRTTVLQAHTHQWLGSFGGAGNGDYRGELLQAGKAISDYATALSLPLEQVIVRVDGLYGNTASLVDLRSLGLGAIGRSKEYSLLDLPQVQARLALAPDQETSHPESGTRRALFDCSAVPLSASGVLVRLIVATHPQAGTPAPIGVTRDGVVAELFWTTLPPYAFTPADVLDLYLHRGSFETVLSDEDQEQDPDRWYSQTPCGQEFCQILSQWMWNLRLEFGQQLSPTTMRLTECAPAQAGAPPQAAQAAQMEEPALTAQSARGEEPGSYGPPQWARQSYTKGFAGADFSLQPDGTLRCPAGHPLYAQERRAERHGSLRVLYAARIGHCRSCSLRERCQESGTDTIKPRRVSAVFWPVASRSPGSLETPPGPLEPLASPSPCPVLWADWERCQIRRRWLTLLRTQTVTVTQGAPPARDVGETQCSPPGVLTRAQRAHWRLSWAQRLARNRRLSTAPPLTITVHGLPFTFAQQFGFSAHASSG
jgi:hypothetical protein